MRIWRGTALAKPGISVIMYPKHLARIPLFQICRNSKITSDASALNSPTCRIFVSNRSTERSQLYGARIKEARHHRGDFSSKDFSRDFDISCLEIELLGGQTVFFLDVVDHAVGFWSDFFENHGIT